MDRNLERQRQHNAESRDSWDHFAGHRDRVTRLVLEALRGRGGVGRLCVLGAGNCNDLDLKALLRLGAEIHLVDLDGEAMMLALERQGLAGNGSIQAHAGLDLADGVLPESRPAFMPASFDAVLSACLLSQLVEPVIEAVGSDAPGLAEALRALRRRHLSLQLDLLVPGGAALLVSDLVSSATVPDLAQTPAAAVKDLMTGLIEQRNFFSGVNPFALLTDLRDDPVLGGRIDKAALVEPWIWRLSEERSFLVYAIALRRKPA